MAGHKPNSVRITGGRWRGRLLHFPSMAGLRPTADVVRERLFNWLGQDLTGWRCLDLFSGSGALGFEAASRGAAEVWLIERDRLASEALQASRARIGAENVRVVRADVMDWLRGTPAEKFDLVMLDPPFSQGEPVRVLEMLPRFLVPGARVYIEHGGGLVLPAGWHVLRSGRTGQAHYFLLEQGNHDQNSSLSGDV